MAYDVARTRLGNYDLTWNSNALGAVNQVKPDLKLKLKPIKLGSIGDVKLGDRIIGLDDNAKITVQAREIDLTLFQRTMPWYTSGSILLKPATINKDLYDYAQLLVLHPIDVSGTTQDLSLLKATPVRDFMTRDGNDDDIINLEFLVYPDRTLAMSGTITYGYLGAPP